MNWPTVKSGDLFAFVTSGSRGWAKYYSDTGPAFLRVGNLDHDSISMDLGEIQRVNPPRGTEGIRTRVQPADILISITADVGMVGIIPDNFEEAYINQHVSLARPVPTVHAPYLAWFLASPAAQRQFQEFQRGATKVGLGLDDIRAVDVPLPAFSEQRQIVAEIEKQFTRLEVGVASLRRVQANLKRYRAAVLKAACEGRLVSTDGDWKLSTLGEVLIGIEAGRSFRCEERPPKGAEVGVVKVSAVTWGVYNEMESKTCLNAERIEERFFVRPDDFLFSRANTIELIGACVIAKVVRLRVMLSDKILRFQFSPAVRPDWILYWLRSEYGRHEIERLATGNQLSMRNIGQDRIRQISVRLPSIDEQTRIIEEVERRLSMVEKLEAVVTANLQRAFRLRQSLLQRAFNGNLISGTERS